MCALLPTLEGCMVDIEITPDHIENPTFLE
jgi:hypothetical protein